MDDIYICFYSTHTPPFPLFYPSILPKYPTTAVPAHSPSTHVTAPASPPPLSPPQVSVAAVADPSADPSVEEEEVSIPRIVRGWEESFLLVVSIAVAALAVVAAVVVIVVDPAAAVQRTQDSKTHLLGSELPPKAAVACRRGMGTAAAVPAEVVPAVQTAGTGNSAEERVVAGTAAGHPAAG